MPANFKAAQGSTSLTLFTAKGTAYPLIHLLFSQDHAVSTAQSTRAFLSALFKKKKI